MVYLGFRREFGDFPQLWAEGTGNSRFGSLGVKSIVQRVGSEVQALQISGVGFGLSGLVASDVEFFRAWVSRQRQRPSPSQLAATAIVAITAVVKTTSANITDTIFLLLRIRILVITILARLCCCFPSSS